MKGPLYKQFRIWVPIVAILWAGYLQYQQVELQKEQNEFQAKYLSTQLKPNPIVELEGEPQLKGGGGDWGVYGRIRIINEGLVPIRGIDYDARFHNGWSYNSWYWEWMKTHGSGELPIFNLAGAGPEKSIRPFISIPFFGNAAAGAEKAYCGPDPKPFFLRIRLKWEGMQFHKIVGIKFLCQGGPNRNSIMAQYVPESELPKEPEKI